MNNTEKIIWLMLSQNINYLGTEDNNIVMDSEYWTFYSKSNLLYIWRTSELYDLWEQATEMTIKTVVWYLDKEYGIEIKKYTCPYIFSREEIITIK